MITVHGNYILQEGGVTVMLKILNKKKQNNRNYPYVRTHKGSKW